ncbi:MAG: 50S ribosomal protein L10 [Firmicutes bacterium]|nr:50S ribosomal protein L10 [Bacillota bacterium]
MPKVEEKQVVVNEIAEKVGKAASMVLVSARGLTVAQDTELRAGLRKKNVDYKVYKNTMIKRAIEGTPFEELGKDLEGPTAVAFSYDDAAAAAGGLDEFVSKFDKLVFKAGVVDGVYYDSAAIVKIAKIPSREVLLSKLLGSFKAPMASFARVINEVLKAQGGETAAASDAE